MKWITMLLVSQSFVVMAQTTFQEQVARLQNINGFLLDFRPVSAPVRPESSRLELSFDMNPQPSLNTRVGDKDEPVDPPSVVPKLRGRYVWANGLMVGGAVAPGIKFQGYDAKFFSLELGYRFQFAGLDAGVRASYTDGDVTGPITQTDAEDEFSFRDQGLDFSLGKSFGDWHLYGFAGAVQLDSELVVMADGVRIPNDESTWYGGLGVTYDWHKFGLTVEQNFTDTYLANVILGVSYRF